MTTWLFFAVGLTSLFACTQSSVLQKDVPCTQCPKLSDELSRAESSVLGHDNKRDTLEQDMLALVATREFIKEFFGSLKQS